MRLYEKVKSSVYIIAEMSANHANKLENALKLVEVAKEAGADCLKIQTYTADTLTIQSDNDCFKINGGLWDGDTLYNLYKKAYTPWEWQSEIKDACEKKGLDFLSTPFDRTSVDFLEALGAEFYKIASFELIDIPLIEYVASKGKPIIMSCGMASEDEIQEALDTCRRHGNNNIILLKCCSAYPASYRNMNLLTIPDMQQKFNVPIGLSDHSMGSLSSVVGVSLGARVIEKHLCLDRSIENPDAAFSMEPSEFKQMVESIHNAFLAMGQISYQLTDEEERSKLHRRSLFAVKDIQAGDVFTHDNVRSIRPADGLHPRYLSKIIGVKANRAIMRGTPLTSDSVSW